MTVNTLKTRWTKKTITEAMLRIYVQKGVITKEEFKEITEIDY